VERPSGATLGPGVHRPVGATEDGAGVGRPTGAFPGPAYVVRPTGPTTGFTFRPLYQPPFRLGDRFPKNEAVHAGPGRTDFSVEAPPPVRRDRLDLLIEEPAPPRDLHTNLLIEEPAPPLRLRPDLFVEAPAPPRRERTDLSTDERTREIGIPAEPAIGPLTGEIVGGTFTGGATGTLYSWELERDWPDKWRVFDPLAYNQARFVTSGPLPRWSPPSDREWTVSGQASIGTTWSLLRDREWTVSGRAGYGPDWSALQR
jgi:hypothetical protein